MEIAATRTNPFATAERAQAPTKELGKDDFLRLLTTQLGNQDPLKPMDNQAFVAQLAQFASVEQLHTLGANLETLLVAQASANQLQVAGLVGKDVLYRADGVDLAAGGSARLAASLPSRASVVVAIQDASGATVRTLALGPREAGPLEIDWDGRSDGGEPMPAGHYTVAVTATAPDGTPVAVDARARGRVTGAAFGADGPLLLVGGSRVQLSDILEINQG
jgi:flagellar basal-body rod modification protein FlgD